MPNSEPLSEGDIRNILAEDLDGWTCEADKLEKTFELTDFRAAVSFIVRLAFYAEEMNHHPEIENVYDTVHLALTTHDAGDKVTEKDVELARKIEDFAWTS